MLSALRPMHKNHSQKSRTSSARPQLQACSRGSRSPRIAIPTEAGIHSLGRAQSRGSWIRACAGMTESCRVRPPDFRGAVPPRVCHSREAVHGPLAHPKGMEMVLVHPVVRKSCPVDDLARSVPLSVRLFPEERSSGKQPLEPPFVRCEYDATSSSFTCPRESRSIFRPSSCRSP